MLGGIEVFVFSMSGRLGKGKEEGGRSLILWSFGDRSRGGCFKFSFSFFFSFVISGSKR